MDAITCKCKKEDGKTGTCFSYIKNGYCPRVCYCRSLDGKKAGMCSCAGGGVPGCEH